MNGILWERFTSDQQAPEIRQTWPSTSDQPTESIQINPCQAYAWQCLFCPAATHRRSRLIRLVMREHDADGCGSFAAAERSISDRLLFRDSAAEPGWGLCGDQCQFFYSIKGFDRSLTFECSAFGTPIFAIPHPQRPAVFRVLCASACFVLFQSPIHIIRDSGVQTVVRALQDVDDPLHSGDSNVFVGAGRLQDVEKVRQPVLFMWSGLSRLSGLFGLSRVFD